MKYVLVVFEEYAQTFFNLSGFLGLELVRDVQKSQGVVVEGVEYSVAEPSFKS